MLENLLRMKRFSQRKGLKSVAEVIQIDSMSAELRNSLWNVLDVSLWSSSSPVPIRPFSERLWFFFFKKPIDSRPDTPYRILARAFI